MLHVSCWGLFSSGFAILPGWYLVDPPGYAPQNAVISGDLLAKTASKRRSWAKADQIDARVVLGLVFKGFREPPLAVSCFEVGPLRNVQRVAPYGRPQ